MISDAASSVRHKHRVLFSVKAPGPDTNPFITLLADSVQPTVEIIYFRWLRALLWRYDVLHIHWPEDLFRSRKRVAKFLKYVLFTLLFLRLKLAKVPVVWTVHNTLPHEELSLLERRCLRLCESLVTTRVYLTHAQASAATSDGVVIPHGHYRDVFTPGTLRTNSVLTNILYFGFVRQYKGLERLLEAFKDMSNIGLGVPELTIAGKPKPATYGAELFRKFADIPGVNWRLRFHDDEETQSLFERCSLVVLPYLNMGNSGALLLALSFARPVLAPDNAITREIQGEVGGEWLVLYKGELDSNVLMSALHELPAGQPNLSARDWGRVGQAYQAVYSVLC